MADEEQDVNIDKNITITELAMKNLDNVLFMLISPMTISFNVIIDLF